MATTRLIQRLIRLAKLRGRREKATEKVHSNRGTAGKCPNSLLTLGRGAVWLAPGAPASPSSPPPLRGLARRDRPTHRSSPGSALLPSDCRHSALHQSLRFSLLVTAAVVCLADSQAEGVSTGYLYESARPAEGWMRGVSMLPEQVISLRFELPYGARIERVGRRLGGEAGGNRQIGGAILRLSSSADFPGSRNFSAPDVLAHVNFIPRLNWTDDLALPIPPSEMPARLCVLGFTSELLGATGTGFTSWNNQDSARPPFFPHRLLRLLGQPLLQRRAAHDSGARPGLSARFGAGAPRRARTGEAGEGLNMPMSRREVWQ